MENRLPAALTQRPLCPSILRLREGTQHLTQTLHQVQEEHYALKCQRLAVCTHVPSEWAGPPELRLPRGGVLLETGAVRAGFLGDEGGSGF